MLTREDPAEEHDLDHVDELDFLIMFLMHFWSPVSSTDEPQDMPFSFQEVSRMGMPDRNSGAATHAGSRGSVI